MSKMQREVHPEASFGGFMEGFGVVGGFMGGLGEPEDHFVEMCARLTARVIMEGLGELQDHVLIIIYLRSLQQHGFREG